MENKFALMLLALVALIAIIGLILFFKTSATGQYGYKPYTLQETLHWYPYSGQRTVKGGVSVLPFEDAKVSLSQDVYERTKRDAYNQRAPTRTYVARNNCAANIALGTVPEGYTESATYIEMKERYYQNCVPAPRILNKTHIEYCCKRPRN
ncbi:hypothetical protein KY333_01835 [Candidatus Woesearchaeota archaeon]|nr:hypothetical protein [Candidatus Woesearchaeota archaeon]MBW2993856.1 hypothetical protein [Candidatus Woesearchaeota archaeon]